MERKRYTRRAFLRRALVELPIAGAIVYDSVVEPTRVVSPWDLDFAQRTRTPSKEVALYSDEIVEAAESILELHSSSYAALRKYDGRATSLGYLAGIEATIRRDERLQLEESTDENVRGIDKVSEVLLDLACSIYARSAVRHRKLPLLSTGMTLAQILSDVVSTIDFARAMQDDRFREYGLDNHFYERNPLVGVHPRPDFWKQIGPMVPQVLRLTFSYFMPFLGFGNIMEAPKLYANNMSIGRQIRVSMSVGDQVKKQLAGGADKDDIQEFLKNVTLEDLEPAA